MNSPNPHIEAFGTKVVSFRFRGRSYGCALSHGLFSSADIDSGSRFLLKVFSEVLDNDLKSKKPLPRTVLDAGCGTGVLGICAAGALKAESGAPGMSGIEEPCVHVHAQDRDELARIFTAYNARQNGLGPETLSAWTEPLLAGPGNWDLILSNIPAKAGLPVLEDFVSRSASLLSPGGRVLLVAVNTLQDFFDHQIKSKASLLSRENGQGHTVFLYGPGPQGIKAEKPEAAFPGLTTDDFFAQCPKYFRNSGNYEIEKTPYHLDTIHGAPGFDSPGGEVLCAAKLALKLLKDEIQCGASPILIWEGDQGHFSTWLTQYVRRSIDHRPIDRRSTDRQPLDFVLAGRNILSLAAARHNTAAALAQFPDTESSVGIVSAADPYLDREKILKEAAKLRGGRDTQGFPCIAAFPEIIPQTNVIELLWEGFRALASGLVIVGLPSAEAERFDRKRPKDFARGGDLRRDGFRALAYRKL